MYCDICKEYYGEEDIFIISHMELDSGTRTTKHVCKNCYNAYWIM